MQILLHSAVADLDLHCLFWHVLQNFRVNKGVVGCCEGVMYHKSLGLPTDIGLQLSKACYPCSR